MFSLSEDVLSSTMTEKRAEILCAIYQAGFADSTSGLKVRQPAMVAIKESAIVIGLPA